MKVLVELSDEQVGVLGAVTGMLVDVDRTISQLLAVKEGLLAVGARLSFEIGADAAAAVDPGLPDSYAGDAMDLAARAVAAEFAVALQSSDRSIQRRMADADAKVTLFPAVIVTRSSMTSRLASTNRSPTARPTPVRSITR